MTVGYIILIWLQLCQQHGGLQHVQNIHIVNFADCKSEAREDDLPKGMCPGEARSDHIETGGSIPISPSPL